MFTTFDDYPAAKKKTKEAAKKVDAKRSAKAKIDAKKEKGFKG